MTKNNNYTNINFTTTTKIARKGSKIFKELDEAIVLNNNKNIGLLLGGDLAKAVLDSGILQHLKEELGELNDKETIKSIRNYKSGSMSTSISVVEFIKKYNQDILNI